MPPKKAKKPSLSIRYLLFADRRLQKLSLRKLTEPAKKTKQPARSRQPKTAAAAKDAPSVPWALSSPAIVLGVIGIVAAATLLTARQPANRADAGRADAPPDAHAALEHVQATALIERREPAATAPAIAAAGPVYTAGLAAGPAPASRPAPAPAVASTRTEAVPSRPPSAAVTPPPKPAAPEPAPRTAATSAPSAVVAPASKAAAAESTAEQAGPAPVTITGCLALEKGSFWLKETSGADAPKSRSWRSGFLKKRPSPTELVDTANTLRLASHVGQRVAATGQLTNRQMRAQSLRPVAASCD